MIPKVHEQHAAMVANPVAPAGQPDRLADVAFAQAAAGVGSITMHGSGLVSRGKGTGAGALVKNGNSQPPRPLLAHRCNRKMRWYSAIPVPRPCSAPPSPPRAVLKGLLKDYL